MKTKSSEKAVLSHLSTSYIYLFFSTVLPWWAALLGNHFPIFGPGFLLNQVGMSEIHYIVLGALSVSLQKLHEQNMKVFTKERLDDLKGK